jgi:prepilin-type N-terminal cleavage/methylation domain-containing protein
MSARPAQAARQRRGLTLLELLIATAVGAVVFGIILEILISTDRAADRMIGREALMQQAQLGLKETRLILENAVWPEDVATRLPAGRAPAFGPQRLAVYSTYRPGPGGLAYYNFRNANLGDRKVAGYDRFTTETAQQAPPLSSLGANYESEIEFRYASTVVGAENRPGWVESLPALSGAGKESPTTATAASGAASASARPGLVWMRLTVRELKKPDPQSPPAEVRLQTAVQLDRIAGANPGQEVAR